jgi:hypothetical protein
MAAASDAIPVERRSSALSEAMTYLTLKRASRQLAAHPHNPRFLPERTAFEFPCQP